MNPKNFSITSEVHGAIFPKVFGIWMKFAVNTNNI